MSLAYIDGDFIPPTDVRLPIHDAGFVWGAIITDQCRTVKHQLYRWHDHLERFRKSCSLARVPLAKTDAEITAAAEQIVAHNTSLISPNDDLALVLLATPGPIHRYLGEPAGPAAPKPRFLMHTLPLPISRYRPFFERGAKLITPATRQVPPACIDPHIKHRSRLHWWIAEQEVKASDPEASALLLDLNDRIMETAFANILLVKNGAVHSPPQGTVLDGVSLRVVRELCERERIPFIEMPLTLEDCVLANEAMLTCTSFCLAPVCRINNIDLECPGPIFEHLLSKWSEMIGLDIRRQFLI